MWPLIDKLPGNDKTQSKLGQNNMMGDGRLKALRNVRISHVEEECLNGCVWRLLYSIIDGIIGDEWMNKKLPKMVHKINQYSFLF